MSKYVRSPAETDRWLDTRPYPNSLAEQQARAEFDAAAQEYVSGWLDYQERQVETVLRKSEDIGDRILAAINALEKLESKARRGDELDLDEVVALDRERQTLTDLATAMPGSVANILTVLADPFASWSAQFDKYAGLPRPVLPGSVD